MKKLLKIFAFIAAFVCLTGFAACGEKDSSQVTVAHTVGTFSGYCVDLAKITIPDTDVPEVVVDYEVDGVFIASLPNPSWKYIVWTDEDNYIYLNKAYEEGIITYDDLVAIAKVEGSMAVSTVRTVGTFSGYRVALVQYKNQTAIDGEVNYTVDMVYISKLANSSFDYVVYTADDVFISLYEAYNQGIISRDDLMAISAAEGGYDVKGKVFIIPQRTVGSFSGCRIEVAQVIEPNNGYPCVEVSYAVDGIFIGYLPDPSFKYLVYEDNGDYYYLDVAYEQGIITRDDLVSIAKTEAEYNSVNT